MGLYYVPVVVHCFRLIFIVKPRLIFSFLMALLWFDLVSLRFVFFGVVLVEITRLPSPDFQFYYGSPKVLYCYPMVSLCFRLVSIVCPRLIFGFIMVFLWFC